MLTSLLTCLSFEARHYLNNVAGYNAEFATAASCWMDGILQCVFCSVLSILCDAELLQCADFDVAAAQRTPTSMSTSLSNL